MEYLNNEVLYDDNGEKTQTTATTTTIIKIKEWEWKKRKNISRK